MGKTPVGITAVWLRKVGGSDQGGGTAQVLVEIDGTWRLVIEEQAEGNFSHIAETSAISNAPVEE